MITWDGAGRVVRVLLALRSDTRHLQGPRRPFATLSNSITEGALPEKSEKASLPTFALIGRPNVGKSTMFNRLVGRKVALVYNTPGSHVTRDYKEATAHLLDLTFTLIDTSGLEPFMHASSIQGRATSITQQVCLPPHDSLGLPQALAMSQMLRRKFTCINVPISLRCWGMCTVYEGHVFHSGRRVW
jgi:hypothetical protein